MCAACCLVDAMRFHLNLYLYCAGDRVRLEKVLAVGARDFTLFGRPVLPREQVNVEATCIEKSLDYPQIVYRFLQRRRFKKLYGTCNLRSILIVLKVWYHSPGYSTYYILHVFFSVRQWPIALLRINRIDVTPLFPAWFYMICEFANRALVFIFCFTCINFYGNTIYAYLKISF